MILPAKHVLTMKNGFKTPFKKENITDNLQLHTFFMFSFQFFWTFERNRLIFEKQKHGIPFSQIKLLD